MFCPKCKAEYVPGVVECADCHVPLVDFLPEEPDYKDKFIPEYVKLVSVYSGSDLGLVSLAKTLLDNAEIPFYVKGEQLMANRGPLVIQVGESDVNEARGILRELVN